MLRSAALARPGFACVSSSAAGFSGVAGGGAGEGFGGGRGGGGGDGSGGQSAGDGEVKSSLAVDAGEASGMGADVIILDVGVSAFFFSLFRFFLCRVLLRFLCASKI